MSIQRKVKREQQIQGRKALRAELKDQVVRDFVNEQVERRGQSIYDQGVYDGKWLVIHAADHLEYTL